jgi:anaerobic dimethyl sulfoxide reductase subunit B (iron-sulfur subunit)
MSLGFYFDAARCIGCCTCMIACKGKNDLLPGVNFRKVTHYETGKYPDAKVYHLSISCQHCENPACVAVCPTGAMYQSEEGVVLHDDEICTGCESCVNACPYGEPQLIEELGIVQKCDSCAALRAKGENPACVDACLTRCLKFGDVDTLKAEYGEDLVSELPVLPAAETTSPNLYIRTSEESLAKDFTQKIF